MEFKGISKDFKLRDFEEFLRISIDLKGFFLGFLGIVRGFKGF